MRTVGQNLGLTKEIFVIVFQFFTCLIFLWSSRSCMQYTKLGLWGEYRRPWRNQLCYSKLRFVLSDIALKKNKNKPHHFFLLTRLQIKFCCVTPQYSSASFSYR